MKCPQCETDLNRNNSYVVRTNDETGLRCGSCMYLIDYDAPLFDRNAQGFDPVVVHRGPNGEIRYPGRADAAVPEGYQKVELRTGSEVHAFEREVNAKECSRYERYQEGREAAFADIQGRNRSDLRASMRNMSEFGRDFARAAIEQNNQKTLGSFDPGFHLEAFHYDASNRAGECSERTDWKRRK